jgi:eukaryotic-like serine/threonine-protein kinase
VQLAPGSKIGAYTLESPLGVGAFGVVWLARRSADSERVAIKIMHPEAALSRENVERFRREAWALSRLESPHIARMYEFLTGPPLGMALVMEYIEGDLLSEVFKRATFSVEDAVGLGIGILSGVAEMQSMGMIHRDIKPENVILRPNQSGWHAVIFDFNLSRMGKMSSLTSTHAAIGTVPYMAPEQLLDARRVTEASDVYSTGTVLYRATAGVLPFDAKQILREKLQKEPRPLRLSRSDPLAKGFASVVMRAIRRRPADRYPNARAMLSELTAIATRSA